MAVFTYVAPTVGGSQDSWGDTLNQNWANLSAFLGSLDSAELGKLDGLTATTGELNILDGVTSTTAEINILDGVTATTTEINYLDGVTSAIQPQLAAIASVPTGAVFYFATTQAPAGYVIANGQALSRTTYADLFAVIGTTFGSGTNQTTFNIPDLRGEFIRGYSAGRSGVDANRFFGSAQSESFKEHSHDLYISTTGGESNNIPSYPNVGVTGESTGGNGWRSNLIKDVGSSETRPRNVALLACIKV
jgi:hypothetical protein